MAGTCQGLPAHSTGGFLNRDDKTLGDAQPCNDMIPLQCKHSAKGDAHLGVFAAEWHKQTTIKALALRVPQKYGPATVEGNACVLDSVLCCACVC